MKIWGLRRKLRKSQYNYNDAFLTVHINLNMSYKYDIFSTVSTVDFEQVFGGTSVHNGSSVVI